MITLIQTGLIDCIIVPFDFNNGKSKLIPAEYRELAADWEGKSTEESFNYASAVEC